MAQTGSPASVTSTLPLQSAFHARTPLRTIITEVVGKVSGTPGFPHAESNSDGITFLVLINGPPARHFILRRPAGVQTGSMAAWEWELVDHSTGHSVSIGTEHVACHLMLERKDTLICAYPSYAHGEPSSPKVPATHTHVKSPGEAELHSP